MEEIVKSLSERIVQRKLAGEGDASLIKKLCNLGLDEKTAQTVISDVVSAHLKSELKLRRFQRRIESLMDAHRMMRQLDTNAGCIERIHKPHPKEFLDKYYSKGIPVIVTGLMDQWPALNKWSPDYLRDKYGDVIVEVMLRREEDNNYELNRDEHKEKILLSDFIDRVEGKPSNDYYMVAHNFAITGPLAELANDIKEIPGIFYPPDNLTEINFWFGPAGTVTPLHHDVTNVLLGQMWGERQITIYPWLETYLLYNEVASFSRFDPEAPDFERYPLAANATPTKATIKRGEALFIPVGTWHHVRSLSSSISLSMSQFVFPNRYIIHAP